MVAPAPSQVLHTELETLLRQLEGYRAAKLRTR